MYNICIFFELRSQNKLKIRGTMLVPYDGSSFFRPHSIQVFEGVIDTNHRINSGKNGDSKRKFKDEIIKKYCKENNVDAIIQRPFYYNGGKESGLVTFISNMLGMNSNKNNSLVLLNPGYPQYKLAKLFQNLLKCNDGVKEWEVIDMEDMTEEMNNSMQELINNYDNNLKTATINLKEGIKYENNTR